MSKDAKVGGLSECFPVHLSPKHHARNTTCVAGHGPNRFLRLITSSSRGGSPATASKFRAAEKTNGGPVCGTHANSVLAQLAALGRGIVLQASTDVATDNMHVACLRVLTC